MAQTRRRPKRNKRSRARKDGGRRGGGKAQQGQETKVWHDPLMTEAGRRAREEADEKERIAEAKSSAKHQRRAPVRRTVGRVVAAKASSDPRELERQRLLDRLLNAEGKPSITAAADLYFEAGFDHPRTQAACLQLLEHRNEERIRAAIATLTELLDEEVPSRKAVLDSRLRRIVEFADEKPTRAAADELRRLLTTLATGSSPS